MLTLLHVEPLQKSETNFKRHARLPNESDAFRWNKIKEALNGRIKNFSTLEKAIKSYNSKYATVWDFSTLRDLVQNSKFTHRFFWSDSSSNHQNCTAPSRHIQESNSASETGRLQGSFDEPRSSSLLLGECFPVHFYTSQPREEQELQLSVDQLQ